MSNFYIKVTVIPNISKKGSLNFPRPWFKKWVREKVEKNSKYISSLIYTEDKLL